jgi:hypothetical protein
MSISPVDSQGNATPEYYAYMRVTSDKWLLSGGMGPPPPPPRISFDEFVKTINEDKVVDPGYARAIPQAQRQIFEGSARSNGAYAFESQALSMVEKAYKLGLVDHNDLLVSFFDKRS